jgi:predicted transposase YbfD/YdcC
MLEVAGAIVTIDAIGCQKEIARTIRGRKADHEDLFEQVGAFCDGACGRGMKLARMLDWSPRTIRHKSSSDQVYANNKTRRTPWPIDKPEFIISS